MLVLCSASSSFCATWAKTHTYTYILYDFTYVHAPQTIEYWVWNKLNWTRSIDLIQRVSIACYAQRCISYDRFRLSVRSSARLSQPITVSKWFKLRSRGLHWRIAHDSSFLKVNFSAKFQSESTERDAESWERGRKNTQFSANKSPYLRNGAR